MGDREDSKEALNSSYLRHTTSLSGNGEDGRIGRGGRFYSNSSLSGSTRSGIGGLSEGRNTVMKDTDNDLNEEIYYCREDGHHPWLRATTKNFSVAVLAITLLVFCLVAYSILRLHLDNSIESTNGVLKFPEKIWMWEDKHFELAFLNFVEQHARQYDGEERSIRFKVFKQNLILVYSHNEKKSPYKMEINKFGDWTLEEFNSRMKGLNRPRNFVSKGVSQDLHSPETNNENYELNLPDTVDWRLSGCVAPVKNQSSHCGSCWAFSAIGALESANCIANGTLELFSEQQLVDCSIPEMNNGCNGGYYEAAWQYFFDDGNYICTEDEYPYIGYDENCNDGKCQKKVVFSKYNLVRKRSEGSLKYALANHGPVSVSVDASDPAFMFYKSGVLKSECGINLDHAVVAIGYGTDAETGLDYWLVRNSWGPDWGEKGYIRVAMHSGSSGECGILLDPAYPLMPSEM